MAGNDVVIVTYNALDGVCAAAVALRKVPDADLSIASRNSVAHALSQLAERPSVPREVHICGVGFKEGRSTWADLQAAGDALRNKGAAVVWHCGRGYLDKHRTEFDKVATTDFVDAGSNAAAVRQHLDIKDDAIAERLVRLSRYDANICDALPSSDPPDDEERFWIDLFAQAALPYFKFGDRDTLPNCVRALSEFKRTPELKKLLNARPHILVGRSRAIASLREAIAKLAKAKQPVFIVGETGVGKEQVAQLLHEGNGREASPFVAVNCACYAGSPDLARSALFGHVKGAFTGANADVRGAFRDANGGVLFLDEVHQLPLEVQAMLLRAVQERVVTPVGSTEETAVDVRIVAACNQDPAQLIRDGKFLPDLYYRLAVLSLDIPPLRSRPEDVDALVENRLWELNGHADTLALSNEDRVALRDFAWPGNVRQLFTVLDRVRLQGVGVADVLEGEREFHERVQNGEPAGAQQPAWWPQSPDDVRPLEEVRSAYARRTLELHNGSVSTAAKALGVAENTLRKLVRNNGEQLPSDQPQ